jgi:polyhydroxyalkanoate synthesis regulator protein
MFSSDVLSKIIRFYGNAMQGMMGNYLEKNIQTFVEIQKKLQAQSSAIYGGTTMPNADAWSEFLKMQGPAIQGLMGSYLEQSANAFLEMQQQMQKQSRNLFGTFPFPNFVAPNPFAPAAPDSAANQPASSPAPKDEDGDKNGA